MKTRTFHINIILLLLIATAGCQTADKDKTITLLELHIETSSDGTPFNAPVPIYRAEPMMVNVERAPFIDERDVESAAVVEDTNGLFMITIAFNGHGASMLENITRANPSRRVAIKADFGPSRWLAAPQLNRPITTGQISFTPDATREESERIVRGLTNVAATIKKKETF
jgi:preprotein translocase subunit SecD